MSSVTIYKSNSKANFNLVEVDILQGMAVILILINHLTVSLIGEIQHNIFIILLNFIGSFAPVLFFFVTGLGAVLSSKKNQHFISKEILIKSFVLILLDITIRYKTEISFGIDFLAFIGISLLILDVLKQPDKKIKVAAYIIMFLLLFRYILGPFILNASNESQNALLQILTGFKAVEGLSYWVTPWITYPLFGFIVGVLIKRNQENFQSSFRKVNIVCFLIATTIIIISVQLKTFRFEFFRWVSVSVNSYYLILAIIMLAINLSYFIKKFDALSQLVVMRGVSCLLVVPLHYFVLNYFNLGASLSGNTYLFVSFLPLWVVNNYFLANALFKILTTLKWRLGTFTFLIVSVMALLCLIVIKAEMFYIFSIQITLCFFLLNNRSKSTKSA